MEIKRKKMNKKENINIKNKKKKKENIKIRNCLNGVKRGLEKFLGFYVSGYLNICVKKF
jgi:hypothetical protein